MTGHLESAAYAQAPLISDIFSDSLRENRSGEMSDLFWLSDEQMARFQPDFPMSHGKPRVDDKRVLRAFPVSVETRVSPVA